MEEPDVAIPMLATAAIKGLKRCLRHIIPPTLTVFIMLIDRRTAFMRIQPHMKASFAFKLSSPTADVRTLEGTGELNTSLGSSMSSPWSTPKVKEKRAVRWFTSVTPSSPNLWGSSWVWYCGRNRGTSEGS